MGRSPRVLGTYLTMVHDFRLSSPIAISCSGLPGYPNFYWISGYGILLFRECQVISILRHCRILSRSTAVNEGHVLSSSNILGRCFPQLEAFAFDHAGLLSWMALQSCKSLDFPSLPWAPCYCLRPALVRRRSRWLSSLATLGATSVSKGRRKVW